MQLRSDQEFSSCLTGVKIRDLSWYGAKIRDLKHIKIFSESLHDFEIVLVVMDIDLSELV